jgi:hypothetical protein
MHKSTQQDHINKKTGPLVVAFIGQDDPLRGDSKGAIGVARHVAQMLGGRYEYVDAQSLSQKFNQISGYNAQLKAYAQQVSHVDIIIGNQSADLSAHLRVKPSIEEHRWNEGYSNARSNNGQGLVSHDLTDAALIDAGVIFRDKVKNIRGSLIGVMLGGAELYGTEPAAKKMSEMVQKMGHDVTFYLCPSLRTGPMYQRLKEDLELFAQYSETHIQVMGEDYATITAGYNPYHGLLDQAEHLVLLGESGSLVSEALYTKKPLYLGHSPFMADALTAKGHIIELSDISNQVFRKAPMPRIDVTAEVAQSIAEEYLDIHAAPLRAGMGGV